ncbi:D-inositol-3-phosphate glycosyltransferase [uncultured archaeon]|nr:D-inositol-3-phosphate glycosyltransferase [uncultured archaeon]
MQDQTSSVVSQSAPSSAPAAQAAASERSSGPLASPAPASALPVQTSFAPASSSTSKSGRPLRVIEVVHAFEPRIGGIETHVRELGLAFARQNVEVVVHTAHAPGDKEVDALLAGRGVRVKRHFAIQFPFFSSLVWMPGLPLFVALERGDMVCAHGFGALAPVCAAIGAKLSGRPFYWTIHGLPRFRGSFGRIALSLYSALLAPIGLWASRKLIAVSEPVAAGLRERGVRKDIAVIPNGISKQFLEFRKEEAPLRPTSLFTVLFVGRLDRSKGVRSLARAFAAFHARHADSVLRFVGPDEGERAWLESYAKENRLPVQFEQVPTLQMPGVYSSAAVTVLPSEYEGFGLCMLESWACGTPALSTAVGAAPGFVQTAFGPRAGEFLFRDEKELDARLEAVHAASAPERRLWAERARRALSAYGWDEVAKKTLETIRP